MIDYLRRFFGLKKRRGPGDGPVGWTSLAALLEDLEKISKEHEEVFDTDVREQMWTFLEGRFIQQNEETTLPTEFGMFSAEGNEKIREAFARNTKDLDTIIEIFSLDTYEKRMTTFTNPKIATPDGSRLDDFFGAP
jgi:hypothetical protein